MGIVILTLMCLLIAIISYLISRCTTTEIVSGVIAFFCFAMFVAFSIANLCYLISTREDPACYNEYLLLETLKPSIEASEDEAIRFDYYQKVEKYNAKYDKWKSDRESFWFSWITGNQYNNCERIEFELRTANSTDLESEAPAC